MTTSPVLGPIAPIAYPGDRCGEGALWSAEENALYWTDINRNLVHRMDYASRAVTTVAFEAPAVALSLTTEPGTILVALGSHLVLWRPEDDNRRPQGFALDGWPGRRLNDGRTDPAGRFWVGSMRNNVGPDGEQLDAGGTEGELYRIGGEGDPSVFRDGIGVSNTLCWSPDRTRFYFADTLANVIWVHDYDAASARIGAPEMFFAGHERGWPDGSAIDAEGYLWNCRFGGGCVLRIAPDGTLESVVEMPVTSPTTAAFGGPDLSILHITSASVGAPATERLAGALFAIPTGVCGLPENHFRL